MQDIAKYCDIDTWYILSDPNQRKKTGQARVGPGSKKKDRHQCRILRFGQIYLTIWTVYLEICTNTHRNRGEKKVDLNPDKYILQF